MTFTQENLFNLIGVIGGFAISLSLVPQVILTFKTKCTTDISFFYQAIYIFGTALVNTYAIYFNYWAVYVPCLVEMTLIIALTIMKVIYDKRNERIREKSGLVQRISFDLSRSAHVRTCHLTKNSSLDLNPRAYRVQPTV